MWEFQAALDLAGDSPEGIRKKLSVASSLCGRDKLERGLALIGEGRLEDARDFFRDVVKNHPRCPAAKEAKGHVSELTQRILKNRREEREKAKAGKAVASLAEGISDAREHLARGDQLRKLGFSRSGSLGKAEDAFQASIESYGRGRKTLDGLLGLAGIERRIKEIRELDRSLVGRLGAVYVDLGHNYIVKGNLVKANRYMGLALAIDPNDPRALALRQAIGIASGTDRFPRAR
jgi:tetratricopeptide (TPR) repeat protein